LPNSAAIGFSATTVMSGAPKEMERTPSADQATSQERRVSIVPAIAAWPPTGAVVITYDTMARTKHSARLILLSCSQSKRRANAASASATSR
jgi:hypothetical protein